MSAVPTPPSMGQGVPEPIAGEGVVPDMDLRQRVVELREQIRRHFEVLGGQSSATSRCPAVSDVFGLKAPELMLRAETGEGAPKAIYGAECLACTARSGLVDNDPNFVEVWAIEHTRAHSTHRQFLVTTRQHWRVDPFLNPYPEES